MFIWRLSKEPRPVRGSTAQPPIVLPNLGKIPQCGPNHVDENGVVTPNGNKKEWPAGGGTIHRQLVGQPITVTAEQVAGRITRFGDPLLPIQEADRLAKINCRDNLHDSAIEEVSEDVDCEEDKGSCKARLESCDDSTPIEDIYGCEGAADVNDVASAPTTFEPLEGAVDPCTTTSSVPDDGGISVQTSATCRYKCSANLKGEFWCTEWICPPG
jgi:hypothetical protein